jgi:ferric iron reductase protein FhuF
MLTLTPSAAVLPIVNALEAIRARRGAPAVHNVTPSLVVEDAAGWTPAGPSLVPEFVDAARARWAAERHVATALAWKSYTYGVVLPVALGYATAGVVPDLSAGNVLVRLHGRDPFVEVGVRAAQTTDALQATLLDEHLLPMLDRLHEELHIGRRTLLGAVASAICHAMLRASDILPGTAVSSAHELLEQLGLADLVDFGPDATGRLTVSRRTCCLAFALPTPRVCAGCCIPAAR